MSGEAGGGLFYPDSAEEVCECNICPAPATCSEFGRCTLEQDLPHEPFWNLLPMGGGRRWKKPPWECGWHGWVEEEKCGDCIREHAEYLETGRWEQ